ncbi:MAG: hypothetical protein A3K19_02380 [Lentisphaerae bacterium RIFOXYB12_FULL_65_16]|nr:MAG: hypothetical protein A3K18_13075 [Lentisphaerae bacterium RIFOXYA12_64_32]OGV86725.1 MAG: hypothetical protein A3K19_02380 [Lentisphaerae bacterium RIFOXYB12_FULL_65_16]
MTRPPEYTLLYPPVIRFGWGARHELTDVLKRLGNGRLPRALLVSIRSLTRTGQVDEFAALCGGELAGRFSEVEHDPSLATVDRIAQMARDTRAEALVAVGGGSVIDAAKAAAILAPLPVPAGAYFRGERPLERPGLPFVALPTTAGTGAEITKNSVLTDTEAKVKASLRSPHMVPFAAIVDAELTVTQPPALTAASGLDALTQAIESYVSKHANAVTRALAISAVQRLMCHLGAAYRDGTDRAARTAVAEGSLLSGMAFSQSGLGAVHGLAHPLGLTLGLAHGLTCAILLPPVLRWNLPACRPEFTELAAVTGSASADEFVAAVARMARELGVPEDFRALGLTGDRFEYIVANCRSASMKANPRPMSDADVVSLLSALSAGSGNG